LQNDELEAIVTSARPLSAAIKKQLSESLVAATGKEVQLTLKENPAVLGGLLVELGSLRLDATLAGALTTLRSELLAHAQTN
jgi:F-type H+-transporting ATPase subunit delta